MTFAPLGRLRELVLNISLACSTVARHLGDDPLLLVIQVSRRLPRGLTTRVGTSLARLRRGGLRHVAGLWLLERQVEARAALSAITPPAAGLRARLFGELAVQLGLPDAVPEELFERYPAVRARASWQSGALTAAAQAVAGQRRHATLRRRLRSEIRIATPGQTLQGDRERPLHRPAAVSVGPRAFHVLTNSLPHTESGYAQRTQSVLRAQQAAGIQVSAATRLAYPVSVGKIAARHTDVVDGVTYHRLIPGMADKTADERIAQTGALLTPLARGFGAQVLQATTNFTNALVAREVAGRLDVPWTYEVRGLLEETWVARQPEGAEQERAAGSEKYALLRARETELARAADHVFTLSRTLRDELVARGVPSKRITLVPNAVDESLLSRALEPARARRAVGLPEGGFWVGTVSSLVDYEGLDVLLDAVALLRAGGVDARALIVGDGVSRGALEAQARRLGLGQAAVFTGRVSRENAPVYHQALDVFAVPRQDVRVCRLVTPLKPIEAMALGRPVVASDLPALAELVTEPNTGVLAQAGSARGLAQAIGALAADEDQRTRLGANGRAFATTRTWAANGAEYRRVLGALIA